MELATGDKRFSRLATAARPSERTAMDRVVSRNYALAFLLPEALYLAQSSQR